MCSATRNRSRSRLFGSIAGAALPWTPGRGAAAADRIFSRDRLPGRRSSISWPGKRRLRFRISTVAGVVAGVRGQPGVHLRDQVVTDGKNLHTETKKSSSPRTNNKAEKSLGSVSSLAIMSFRLAEGTISGMPIVRFQPLIRSNCKHEIKLASAIVVANSGRHGA